MERGEAIERVRKLSEVTVERGATPNEAEVARQKSARLVRRWGILPSDLAPPQPSPPPMPVTASTTGVWFHGGGVNVYVRWG